VSAARLPWAIAGALGLAMLGAAAVAVLRAPQPDAPPATALRLAPPIPAEPAASVVGLIITGLGGTAAETRLAIGLPAAVGLAFSPYAADVARWMAAAAADGHEVYLELPLEAADTLRVDQGPLALGPASDAATIARRLDAVLALPGAPPIGVVAAAGAFARAPEAFTPVATALAARGLVFVELGGRALEPIAAMVGLRYRSAVGPLEADLSPEAIEAGLAALAAAAQDEGAGLGFIAAFPLTVDRVAGWLTRLDALGLALRPPSRADVATADARASK
jgi:polysaccharide deacetylase 2 family uncharacterized protein YibQ